MTAAGKTIDRTEKVTVKSDPDRSKTDPDITEENKNFTENRWNSSSTVKIFQ